MALESQKHPSSLRIFFITEMWERYGFYVVQSLLALYMAHYFQWQDNQVYALVGSFTAITYLSPFIGGFIADHLLGQKKTIILGAITLFLSYLILSLGDSETGLIGSLAGVAVGTGLLKPNISSLLGNEYPLDCPRRESGFTIFYMGITSGIILGTLLPSQLNAIFGWSISFLSASFGMIIAILVFLLGVKRYQIQDYNPIPWTIGTLCYALVLMAMLWTLSFLILNSPHLADISFGLIALTSLIYLIITARYETGKQSKRTIVIALLCVVSVMFWAFYFQMFMSLTLFIARVVEPTLLGYPFPPPYYVCVQSIGMLIFGYFLSSRHQNPKTLRNGISTGNKFMLAMVFMILAYGLISFVCYFDTQNTLLSPWLFLPAYLFISIAELLLSPVGLSAITTLASRHRVSTMMGIFFVSLGLGGYLSGKLSTLTAVNPTLLSIEELKNHYATSFNTQLVILIFATFLCFFLNTIIKMLLKEEAS